MRILTPSCKIKISLNLKNFPKKVVIKANIEIPADKIYKIIKAKCINQRINLLLKITYKILTSTLFLAGLMFILKVYFLLRSSLLGNET